MKKLLLLLTLITAYYMGECQLDKGIWLAGGEGNLFSYNETSGTNTLSAAKYTTVNLSASIGYFIVDKLTFGLRPTFFSMKGGGRFADAIQTNYNRFWIGPFGRYYFLNKEKQYNILTDISYQTGNLGGWAKGNLTTFTALAGPVIFFNSSIGLEVLCGYHYSRERAKPDNKLIQQGFQTNIGFQFHLEKK